MNRIIPASSTSLRMTCSRSSNAPRETAPARNDETSSDHTGVPCRAVPTRFDASARAVTKPSAQADLPTPASPTTVTEFWRRRSRIDEMAWNCSSKPIAGSKRPSRAAAIMSQPYRESSGKPVVRGSLDDAVAADGINAVALAGFSTDGGGQATRVDPVETR